MTRLQATMPDLQQLLCSNLPEDLQRLRQLIMQPVEAGDTAEDTFKFLKTPSFTGPQTCVISPLPGILQRLLAPAIPCHQGSNGLRQSDLSTEAALLAFFCTDAQLRKLLAGGAGEELVDFFYNEFSTTNGNDPSREAARLGFFSLTCTDLAQEVIDRVGGLDAFTEQLLGWSSADATSNAALDLVPPPLSVPLSDSRLVMHTTCTAIVHAILLVDDCPSRQARCRLLNYITTIAQATNSPKALAILSLEAVASMMAKAEVEAEERETLVRKLHAQSEEREAAARQLQVEAEGREAAAKKLQAQAELREARTKRKAVIAACSGLLLLLLALPATGIIAPLLCTPGSASSVVQETAARALSALADNDGNQITDPGRIAAADAINPLVSLLGSSSVGVQEAAAGALKNLAFNNESQIKIAATGATAPLVSLLGSSSAGVQQAAAGALWNLAYHNDDNKIQISVAGAIAPLVTLLGSSSVGVQRAAAGALKSLACNDNESRRVKIAAAGAIEPLINLLRSSSASVQEEAAGALLNLSVENNRNKVEIAAAGAKAPLTNPA